MIIGLVKKIIMIRESDLQPNIEKNPDNNGKETGKKEERNDFGKQEIRTIMEGELEIYNEISKKESEKERREKINGHIDKILEEFKKSKGEEKDFKMMMIKIQVLDINGKLDKADTDRSWNQEQVDDLIKIFEENEKGSELPDGSRDYFPKLYSLFYTGCKKEREENTISELAARSLAERMENGGIISNPLQEEIKMWCQDIQMIDKDARIDLLAAALNNPGKIYDSYDLLLSNLGLYGKNFIRQLKGSFEKNKADSNKTLRIIEILNFLRNKKYQIGFEKSGEEAEKILDEIYNENDNFFIKTKIEQVLSYNRKERTERNNRYDEVVLRENYDIVPYMAEGAYNKENIIAASCYSRISDKYGALYNYNGTVDSVFELDKKIENKSEKLSISEILEKEGFKKESTDKEEYKKMILTYRTLIELPLREKIENEFNIELKNFKIREQVQFVNFLSSKNMEEVKEVKKFLNQEQDKEAKSNRIKSFLSLESGEEMGEKILEIGKELKDQPQAADALFAEYARTIESIYKNSEEIRELYNEIFFDKQINKNEISQAIIRRANNLFLESGEKLEQANENEKEKIIKELIENFEKEEKANKKELEEFRKVAGELNKEYKLLYFGEGATKEGIKQAKDEEEMWEIEDMLEYEEGFNRYDSQRIKEIIESMETEFRESELGKGYGAVFKRHYEEKEKRGEKLSKIDKDFIEIYKRCMIEKRELADKLKKLLPFQIAFEKKLDKLVFGYEAASLPKEILFNLEKEVSEVRPEKIPEKKPVYFPVGISKDLKSWEEVFEGEKQMAKPIDIYGYLFWLNNQEKEVKLIICDEIQKSNYENLFGKNEEEAKKSAKMIGRAERKFYEKIIGTFGLDNIEIVDYETFLSGQKDFNKYKNLAERLSKDQIWANAFLSMVQESIAKQEREKFTPYAIEEVAWILTTDGTKISHLNEARYDVIASVIKNVENYAEEHNIDIFNPADGKKLKPIINSVVRELYNKINQKKQKVDKKSLECQYFLRANESLKKIKKSAEAGYVGDLNKKSLQLNFACPSVGARSFGWWQVKGNLESVAKFKEPYSTYFHKGGAEMFLDSDQVVAVPNRHIGGKVQALETDKQIEYAEKVVKPILVQYFKSLESAPKEYFSQIKKTREELLVECKETATLNDLLKFIQRYIVKPTFSSFPKSN